MNSRNIEEKKMKIQLHIIQGYELYIQNHISPISF